MNVWTKQPLLPGWWTVSCHHLWGRQFGLMGQDLKFTYLPIRFVHPMDELNIRETVFLSGLFIALFVITNDWGRT